MELTAFIYRTVNIIADILVFLIFLRVVLSWFRHEALGLNNFLFQSTEPILKPIRRLLPNMGMLDISPMVTIFAIEILRNIINASL